MDFWSVGRRVLFGLGNGVSCGLCCVVLGCGAAWMTLKVTDHKIKPGSFGMGKQARCRDFGLWCRVCCGGTGCRPHCCAQLAIWRTLAISSGASATFGSVTLSLLANQV
jgi:hypothetical protein